MVSVDIEDIGNITVEDINVIFEVRDALGISESLETCMIDKLSPTESSTCLFDLNVQPGQGKTFRVDIPTEFNSRPDTGPSDNAMLQTTSVLAGDILPFIAMNSNSGIYTTADTIATVNTAGYFNDAIGMIRSLDVIIAVTSTGGTPVVSLVYAKDVSSSAIDVTDGLTVTATDSD